MEKESLNSIELLIVNGVRQLSQLEFRKKNRLPVPVSPSWRMK